MNLFARTSLRFRLMLLVTLAVLPLATFQVYHLLVDRAEDLAELRREAVQIAKLSASGIGMMPRAPQNPNLVSDLQKSIAGAQLPENAVINVVDRNGIELARIPQVARFLGKQSEAWKRITPDRKKQTGPTEVLGIDNVRRLYYFAPVKESGGALWVGIGLSATEAEATMLRQLVLHLVGGGIFAIFVFGLAWYGSEVWILRPVHALTGVSRRLAEGDLSARIQATQSPRELRILAQTFDEMAASLQKNQDELRLTQFAVDHAPEGIVWTNPEGRLIYANEAAIAALGYPLASLLKMEAYQIDTSMNVEDWRLYWKELKSRRTMGFESRYRTFSGREIPAEIRSNYLKFATQEYNCSFIRDISERKKSEEELRALNATLELRVQKRTEDLQVMNDSLASEINIRQQVEMSLRESQRTLATLMSNLPGMAYRCRNDNEWTVEFASEGALALTGYSPADLINNKTLSFASLIHRDDQERVWRDIQVSLANHEPYQALYRIKCANGDQKWVSERGRGVFAEDGKTVVALEGLITDTTKRKLAEEEVYRAHAMLELILNNIPQRVFWKDRSSVFLGCNRVFAEDSSLGAPQEVQGKTDHDLFKFEAAERFRSDDQWVMTNDSPKLNFVEAQHQLDGSQIWLRTNKVPLHDRDGRVIGLLGTYEDITETRRMEQKLRDSLEDLERSNRELEQFAYVASHDLQEPLRLVSSYTQLLSQRYKGKLDVTADEFIGFAVDGAMRMQRLIQDLLTYSRVTSKDNLMAVTDFNSCLRHAIANLSVSIEENKVQVTFDSLPELRAAENQVVQLFQNLIGNAIKFHGQETPKIHVSAKASPDSDQWIFSVRDNGIGIEAEFYDRIFVIFQRLHTRRKYSGTGIGLALCKRIVERHGGRIWLESEPGKGSIFYFTMKADEEQDTTQ